MNKYKEVNNPTLVLSSIICDVCKNEYLVSDTLEMQEFINIKYVSGYLSEFGDDKEIELDMCQHCFNKLLGSYIRIKDVN